MRSLSATWLLTAAFIATTGASLAPPEPVSAKVHPYKPEERGKFVEICFDRALERREEYSLSFDLLTRQDATLNCNGTLVDSFGEKPSACQRFNVFVYCVGRHTPPEKRAIADKEIRPGNVRAVTVRLYRTSGAPSKPLMSRTVNVQ